MGMPIENSVECAECGSYNIGLSSDAYCAGCYLGKQPNFKDFKEFLADECFDLQKYKQGKYDRKIFNWFIKITTN